MSHDEIVGNVLSWLGNWLRDRKQPEPTLLVTNSVCLQASTQRKWALLWMGRCLEGPQKRCTGKFCLVYFERESLLWHFFLRSRMSSQKRINLRRPWEDTCHQRSDWWGWMLAIIREYVREKASFRRWWVLSYLSAPSKRTQDTGTSVQATNMASLQRVLIKYLINFIQKKSLGEEKMAALNLFSIVLRNSVQPQSCTPASGNKNSAIDWTHLP